MKQQHSFSHKRYSFTSIFLCINIIALFAVAERNYLASEQSPETLSEKIILQQEWVKYPSYSDRSAWDELTGEKKRMLIERGEKRLNYGWKVLKATDYLEYERSGERNIMQTPNSENNNTLADLVLAELAEGKGRFIDQIINGVFYQTERTSWVLSAHLPAQSSKRSLPDYTEQVIDLGSAELGAFLAWTYYFLKDEMDKVNPIISQRLREDIYHKIILPYRNNDRFWWQGFHPREDGLVNNWNPWCNTSVLQCILLLENDPEQVGKDVYRTMQSVDKFINYVHSDGACEEGPSYWGHAAGKLYDYLQVLYDATGGKIPLFNEDMIRSMGEYISRSYVGNGWVVNFADASARFSAKGDLIYRYGKAVNSQEMMQFAAYLTKDQTNTLSFGIDFFRSLESLFYDDELKRMEEKYHSPEVTVYPETQFYYFKNKQGFFLATKGGHNAESHNHNDVGTCSLWFEETPILIDAGVGTYVRQTFGPERYGIWTMRSTYHNLPFINGQEQKDGREFQAQNIVCNPKNKTVSFDITQAYPEAAQIKQWNRQYQLKEKSLIIKDRFELKEAKEKNRVDFMLWGDIDISEKGIASITVNNKQIELHYDGNTFLPSLETIPLPDPRLSKVWGKQIFCLRLQAQQPATKGEYTFVIKNKKQTKTR